MPVQVTVHQAKTYLSRLLALVEAGGEVVLMRRASPWPQGGQPGTAKGTVWLAEDFDAPLPEEPLLAFERRGFYWIPMRFSTGPLETLGFHRWPKPPSKTFGELFQGQPPLGALLGVLHDHPEGFEPFPDQVAFGVILGPPGLLP